MVQVWWNHARAASNIRRQSILRTLGSTSASANNERREARRTKPHQPLFPRVIKMPNTTVRTWNVLTTPLAAATSRSPCPVPRVSPVIVGSPGVLVPPLRGRILGSDAKSGANHQIARRVQTNHTTRDRGRRALRPAAVDSLVTDRDRKGPGPIRPCRASLGD